MTTAVHHSIEGLLARVRGEFLEMPGLTLTDAQARRLWGLDNSTCQQLLGRLLEVQFLVRTPDGRYRRADGIVVGPPSSSHSTRQAERRSFMKLAQTFMFAMLLALAFVAMSGTRVNAQSQIPRFEEQETVTGTTVRGALSDQHLTFSGPFAIPGVSLAAGTYVFRFPAPNVIQVLSEDRSQVYAMFMTIPAPRPEAAEQHEVLWDARTDAPPAIKVWYLPDRITGHEPIYPQAAGSASDQVATSVTD